MIGESIKQRERYVLVLCNFSVYCNSFSQAELISKPKTTAIQQNKTTCNCRPLLNLRVKIHRLLEPLCSSLIVAADGAGKSGFATGSIEHGDLSDHFRIALLTLSLDSIILCGVFGLWVVIH